MTLCFWNLVPNATDCYTSMIEMDGVFHDKIETGVDNNFEDENYQ